MLCHVFHFVLLYFISKKPVDPNPRPRPRTSVNGSVEPEPAKNGVKNGFAVPSVKTSHGSGEKSTFRNGSSEAKNGSCETKNGSDNPKNGSEDPDDGLAFLRRQPSIRDRKKVRF